MNDNVAVVSGGSGGIGAAICEELCRKGYVVGVGYASGHERAVAVAERCAHLPGTCVPVELDVSERGSFAALDAFIKEYGTVRVAVAAAGVLFDAPAAFHSPELWKKTLDINLMGAVRLFRRLAPHMKKTRHGRLIAIGSAAGGIGAANRAAYSASKAALCGLIKSLAKEYGHRNVTANVVAPGLIETDMTKNLSGKARDAMLKNVVVGRAGTPSDVAYPVVYLSSPESDYITGQVLYVDGGMVLG